MLITTKVITEEKKEHYRTFVIAMMGVEKEMDNVRQSRKDIIADYLDNDYLDKEEIKKLKQAISLVKKMIDLEEMGKFMEEVYKVI